MKPLAALALLLLLAACTGWSDPYQMVSQGNELIRATERARIEQERAAELEAAQAREAAEWEIAKIREASQATLSAWDILQSQGDATQAAQIATATAEGVLINATQTAMPLQATQTAFPRLAQKEAQSQEFNFYAGIAWKIIIMCAVVVLLIIFVYFAHRLADWFIEWRSWKKGVIETSRGKIVAYMYDNGNWKPVMLEAAQQESYYFRERPNLNVLTQGTQTEQPDTMDQFQDDYEPPASQQIINLSASETRALRVLSAAAEVSGEDGNVIPGWRKMDGRHRIGGKTWENTVYGLRSFELAEKLPDGAYIVTNKYKTIGGLITAIEKGKVGPLPSPIVQS